MGVLKSWPGMFKQSDPETMLIFFKLYTGPGGQTAGILSLWPMLPAACFYLKRTTGGLEVGTNANCEFEEWTPSSCYLRYLRSYCVGSCGVPDNTWVNVIIMNTVSYRQGTGFIQIENDESPLGSLNSGMVTVKWGPPKNLSSVQGGDFYDSTGYIRKYRAYPPPTCYTAPGSFKFFEYYGPRGPNAVTALSAGRLTGGGNNFEGAIAEVSIWSVSVTGDTQIGLRRTPGYALLAPEHTERIIDELVAYWPLIDDGATDFQRAEQDNDLTATPSGTAAFSDCYDFAADGYEPWPIEPGERKVKLITPPRTFSVVTPRKETKLITPLRSATVVTPQRRATITTPARTVTRES